MISCGKVGVSWQASLFGFPNAFLGLIAESVVITIAVASLGGVRFPRWFMLSAQVVYTFGPIFAYWLFSQSLLVIHALCPWCMVLYLSTTLVWWLLARFNIREGNLFLPPGLDRARELVRSGNDVFVVAAWLVLLVALVLAKYGSRTVRLTARQARAVRRTSSPTEPRSSARAWKRPQVEVLAASAWAAAAASSRVCSHSRWPILYDGACPGQPR